MYELSPHNDSPLRQCEIVSGLRRARLAIDSVGNDEEPVVDFEDHDYAILMTQDCDLDLDYKARRGQVGNDKILPDLLFCQALPADDLRGRQNIKSDIWRRITTHTHERYQVLPTIPSDKDLLGDGVPSLGLDFKRFFTMPVDEIYRRIELDQTRRRCYLKSPYLEHLSNRFTHFQGRVAVPVLLLE